VPVKCASPRLQACLCLDVPDCRFTEAILCEQFDSNPMITAMCAAVALAAAAVLYVVGSALFERLAPHRWVTAYQRLANPSMRVGAGLVPGWAVLETTGRKTGLPRQTPIGGRLRGNTYWLVVGEFRRAQYMRNIEADPRVRVRVHGRWHVGTARALPDDDARRRLFRLNPVNSLFIWIAGTDLATVRIDLEGGPER
jgi:deazaflavin-dependent oxidoreductase (nitroreductase family)